MRVIKQNAPGDPLNNGTVVFHAGANVARRWEDFQQYSEADQDYFDQLLPMEDLNFDDAAELEVEPVPHALDRDTNNVEVRAQSGVHLEVIPLIADDTEAMEALRVLHAKGLTSDQVKQAYEELEPVPVTKTRRRQAKRASLDTRVKNEVGRILGEQNINPKGYDLDRKHLGKANFAVLKSAIDRRIFGLLGRKAGERHDYNRQELDQIDAAFDSIISEAAQEVFNA